ncbi:MAG: 16S/23S rRNA (cytidine-2'-O)-methyltransferase TlyA [Candidatus Dichloromethanomonas elyunquensis]|nr:MAG: 16S/23S rRNA (cytidine-2'-O)-methyltransferase TlyA [Candidatus Dichloromethanomonas elyunquensis]
MTRKIRLDLLLVEKGMVESREKAKSLIMAGKVFHEHERLDKPGMMVEEDRRITLKGELHPFVSRGGLKLAKAIQEFGLNLKDKIIADIGASTGGFTDCSLQNGAAKVYAIDVGYGQLDWKLRSDPRVVCLERTNARFLTGESLPEMVDWVVCDVSFISLTKIFPAMLSILRNQGEVLALIKPQFEAGRENVGKNGVVKNPEVHASVIKNVLHNAVIQGFQVKGLSFSPIRGPEGNIEFLVWLKKSDSEEPSLNWNAMIAELIRQAQTGTE